MSACSSVGCHILAGLSGPELSAAERGLIKRFRPAGFVLFGRNVKSLAALRALTSDIRAIYSGFGRPPLIAIDYEGWPVDRFSRLRRSWPGNAMLGAAANAGLARAQGRVMGRDLSGLGINLDFAPVLDLRTADSPPVVAFRSFSPSAFLCSRLGAAVMHGLHEGGVMACPKHFPGIGDCAVDPHFLVPRVPYSLNALFGRTHARPFLSAVRAGAELLMASHVCGAFGPGGSEGLSTCSPAFVRALRGGTGFNGLLVSDDMYMRALTDLYGLEDGGRLALGAGFDLLLMCRPIGEQEKLFARLEKTSAGLAAQKTRAARMKRFFAGLDALGNSAAARAVTRAGRGKLMSDICRAGLKPYVNMPSGDSAESVGAICLRPRYRSFPGAARVGWDGFFQGLRRGGLRVGPLMNLFPAARPDEAHRAPAAMRRARGRFRKGSFVIVCCDGVYANGLVREIVRSLSDDGFRVGLITVVDCVPLRRLRPLTEFWLAAHSGLKCALELSGRLVSGIIKS